MVLLWLHEQEILTLKVLYGIIDANKQTLFLRTLLDIVAGAPKDNCMISHQN